MKKRPFCVMAMLFILGEMACQLKDEGPAAELVPLIAGALVVVISSKFARKIKCVKLLLFLCLFFGYIWALAPAWSGFAGDFQMRGFSAKSGSGRTFAYVRKCEETSGGRFKLILKTGLGDVVSYVDEEVEPGSFLLISCAVNELEGATNPGAMDMEEYYAGMGIRYRVELYDGEFGCYQIGSEPGEYRKYGIGLAWRVRGAFVKALYRFRRRLGFEIDSCFESRDAGLLKAILLGDKSDFDVTDKVVFQRTGMAHIFAISGMHITLVALGVEWILSLFGMTKKRRAFVSIGAVFTYAVMTGLSAATTRALVMYVVSRIAFAVGRTTDAPTSMMTSLFVIVVVSPGQVFSSGVLMSFLSVCGLYSGQRLSNRVLGRYGGRRGRVIAALRARVMALVERLQNGGEEKVQFGRRGEVLRGREKLLAGAWEQEKGWSIKNLAPQIKFWKSIFKDLVRSLMEKLIISGTINLWMLPAVIYLYYEVPVFAMLLNLVLLPLLTFLVAGASLIASLGLLPDVGTVAQLQNWLASPVHALLQIYRGLCYSLNTHHFATISTGHIPLWLLPLLLAPVGTVLFGPKEFTVLAAFKGPKGTFHFGSKKRSILGAFKGPKRTVPNGAIVLMLYAVIAVLEIGIVRQVNRANSETVFMDVGQGDGSIIHVAEDGAGRVLGRGRSYIVDFGSSSYEADMLGRYTLIPALKYYGIDTVDCIFLSHTDADHVNGIIFLLENSDLYGIKVENVAYAAGTDMDDNLQRIDAACQEQGSLTGHRTNLVALSAGNVIDDRFRVIFPDATTANGLEWQGGNDYSLVMTFAAKDYEVLYTGDISSEVEVRIIDRVTRKNGRVGSKKQKLRILKCPHHGSRYSSSDEFLAAYDPDLTVISCGENNIYGHPAEVTLGRLKKIGTKILRTDEDGAVVVE